MAKKLTVGFVGAGLMGHGMAKHLLEAGYPLVTMAHRNRTPIEDLVRRGATEVGSAREVAAAVDMLFLCVTSSPVVASLVDGDNGILAGGRPGLIVVDTTTGDPAATLELGAQLAERGIHLVDAPLARTPRHAEEGRLNILLSGEQQIVDKVHGVAQAFCENVFEIGPLGSALKLKLINNLLSLGHAVLTAEAVVAARATGVDVAKLYEVVSHGGANSEIFEMIVSRLVQGDETGLQFSLRNARKDLGCYRRMVDDAGVIDLLSDSIYETYNLATVLGYGDELVSRLASVLNAEHIRRSIVQRDGDGRNTEKV